MSEFNLEDIAAVDKVEDTQHQAKDEEKGYFDQLK